MSRLKVNKAVILAMIVLMGAALVFSGCSKSPTSFEVEKSQPQVLKRAAVSTDADLAPVDLYKQAIISAEEGGQLSLLDVTIDVPSGAVPNDTLFSIFIPDDEIFYNEFGTDGLVFHSPVTVTMSYRGADLTSVVESTIRIGFFDKATGEWEDVKCDLDQDSKLVTAKLDHFSPYGLISD